MKIAALDLGSNTFLCLIAEVENFKITQIYEDVVEVVRLGQDLNKTKRFHPEALARAKKTLTHFKKIIDQHKPEKILAMATSASRDAENKQELFALCESLNIPLEIIPGEQEAEITFFGATSGVVLDKKTLVVDIGGGSTEFIIGQFNQIDFAKSLNIGCVRLTERFFQVENLKMADATFAPPTEQEIQQAEKFIAEQLQQQLDPLPVEQILAVAGTPTTLAHVEIGGEFDPKKIDGYQFTLLAIDNWVKKLTGLTKNQIEELGFPPGRADVMLIGLLILRQTLKKYDKLSFMVSTRGVRFGVALEVFKRGSQIC